MFMHLYLTLLQSVDYSIVSRCYSWHVGNNSAVSEQEITAAEETPQGKIEFRRCDMSIGLAPGVTLTSLVEETYFRLYYI